MNKSKAVKVRFYVATIVVIVLLIALLAPPASQAEPRLRPDNWARPVIGAGLENLYRVDDELYRSEQPEREDVEDLQNLGITEVLNLREFHQDDDDIGVPGILLHRVRIRTGSMSEEEIVAALRIIHRRHGPLLVHCWHGSDRTGVVIASYRIVFNGWDKEAAIDEMVNGGFGYHAAVYPELVSLIAGLNFNEIRKKVVSDPTQ